MSDLPSALGIEAVEFVAEGGRSVTVRVTGRWRRRRPELRGQAMLVVETGTVRQRFVAMPEPPSLTGAAPGTWRMSVHGPGGARAAAAGQDVPPAGGGDGAAAGGGDGRSRPAPGVAAEGPGPELLEARQLRSSELAAESARRRAAEAEAAVAGLIDRIGEIEDELGRARDESDRLRDVIAERERELRGSQQNIHSERARRTEVEQALTEKTRTATRDLRVLHEHVADLERELGPDAPGGRRGRASGRRRGWRGGRRPSVAWPSAPPEPVAAADAVRRAAVAPESAVPDAASAGAEPLPPSTTAARDCWPRSSRSPGRRRRARRAAHPDPSRRGRPISRRWRSSRRWSSATRHARTANGAPRRSSASSRAPRALGGDVADARGEVARARSELAHARRELERQRLLNERAYAAIDQVRAELARLGAGAPPDEAPRAPAPSGPVQAEKLSAGGAPGRRGPGRPERRAHRLREPAPPAAAPAAPAPARRRPSRRPTAEPHRPADPRSRGSARRSGRSRSATARRPGGCCWRCSRLSAPPTPSRSRTTSCSATWPARA